MADRRTVYVEFTINEEGAVHVRRMLRANVLSEEGGLDEKPARWEAARTAPRAVRRRRRGLSPQAAKAELYPSYTGHW
jgi:hypothetical protein